MSVDSPAIQAVVFDLDDTLYLERDYVRSGYRAVARHLARSLGRTDPLDDWLWDRFRSGRSAGALDAMNEAFGLGLSAGQIADLVGVYREHVPDIHPCPGVPELLADLDRSRRLALLTDGFLPAQKLKLQALGLARRFEAVVFTEELGRACWKPSPAGFQAVRDRLDVPHEACAYVADNPAKDFIAPNRLGWRTVQLRWPGQVHADNPPAPGGQPQIVAARLDDVTHALD